MAIAATLAAGAATYLTVTGVPSTSSLTADAAHAPVAGITFPAHAPATASAGVAGSGTPATRTAKAATATPKATPTASKPKPSPTASKPTPSPTALSCDTSVAMLPANVTAIVSFLLDHGYSDNAAAGIAGNIYQESKGNPESIGTGGGGLIGWTPLRAGMVTGNPATDLQNQLADILTYNEGWAQYLPELNDAATPADAAYIYVTDFERAGIPAASTREASADAVADACGL